MTTGWVAVLAPLLGVVLGVVITALFTSRREDKRWHRELDARRREELKSAVFEYVLSVTTLRFAEFDRAARRLSGKETSEERDDVRQNTYRLRAQSISRAHLLALLADHKDDELLTSRPPAVIELCRLISAGTNSPGAVEARDEDVQAALQLLIDDARERFVRR
ncbi:hypothetical protein VZC37_20720 [Gordonia sp. LSe1-13]|uniref:Secreted protein n=1 Tax=Gordonia sesuvii TaxID=3116777 RepID=A0ABU7MI38_9ACTN|nr:hypothetical protein [Gordonia sp. LSe1-13]